MVLPQLAIVAGIVMSAVLKSTFSEVSHHLARSVA